MNLYDNMPAWLYASRDAVCKELGIDAETLSASCEVEGDDTVRVGDVVIEHFDGERIDSELEYFLGKDGAIGLRLLEDNECVTVDMAETLCYLRGDSTVIRNEKCACEYLSIEKE